MAEQAKPSQKDIEEGLKLLMAKRERERKIEAGLIKPPKSWGDLSPEEKEKAKARDRRYMARQKIILRKAREAGITATDKEIDAELGV